MPNDILELFRSRRSIRKFKAKQLGPLMLGQACNCSGFLYNKAMKHMFGMQL